MPEKPEAPSNPMPGIDEPRKFIKIEKIEKVEHKEKPEKIEFKEKPEKHEHKEKPEKFEHKEKPEKFEHKEKIEKLEHPEKIRIEIGGKDLVDNTGTVFNPGGPIEQRVAALENAIASLQHFITSDKRPDLSRGALKSEPDAKK
jgi:hypothetical protein